MKISDEEVDFLFGLAPEEGADRIFERFGAKLVFVTCGGDGCVYKNANAKGRVAALKNITVADTTGAGDIFGGSAMWKLLEMAKRPDRSAPGSWKPSWALHAPARGSPPPGPGASPACRALRMCCAAGTTWNNQGQDLTSCFACQVFLLKNADPSRLRRRLRAHTAGVLRHKKAEGGRRLVTTRRIVALFGAFPRRVRRGDGPPVSVGAESELRQHCPGQTVTTLPLNYSRGDLYDCKGRNLTPMEWSITPCPFPARAAMPNCSTMCPMPSSRCCTAGAILTSPLYVYLLGPFLPGHLHLRCARPLLPGGGGAPSAGLCERRGGRGQRVGTRF